MARLPRLYFPGCVQHVIQRGNNRDAFFYDEADYKVYLSFVNDAAKKYQVAIHAFVLMTNHVHLLATPSGEQGISRLMQALGRRYVQYINFTYGRTGTLWEGRYKSTLVDSDSYLLTVYRYLELNPVRAGMVTHASEYPWSSYQAMPWASLSNCSLRTHFIFGSVKQSRDARAPIGRCSGADCPSDRCRRFVRPRTRVGSLVRIGSRPRSRSRQIGGQLLLSGAVIGNLRNIAKLTARSMISDPIDLICLFSFVPFFIES